MSDFKKVVETTSVAVLEDWALMLVEPAESGHQIFDADKPCFVASVKFKGVMDGSYSVLCQKPFMETLVDNLVGMDEGSDDAQATDALKELLNVLSGNLLTESYGDDTVFDLIHSEVIEISQAETHAFFDQRVVCFLADDEPVAVTFQVY